MITKETLEAVKNGVLTDEQLNIAIKHYTQLENDLKCHGGVYSTLYHLVWKDVYNELQRLNDMKTARKQK
jgi:hypothetical protein